MDLADNSIHGDHAAVLAAADTGAGLCTILTIDGGFSRRVGAQLAICPDGRIIGSLADGCLENQLASDIQRANGPTVLRYGRGSPFVDFRLPCGGGLDILVDPCPDRQACRNISDALALRQPASLELPANPFLAVRSYIPPLAMDLIGNDPELACLTKLARAAGVAVRPVHKDDLSLGQRPDYPAPDRWTATILLFHDHEWEAPILIHALSGEGFFIGAQGGYVAGVGRTSRLSELGVAASDIDRIKSPVGLITSCREPQALAVSILAEVFAEYEKLRNASNG